MLLLLNDFTSITRTITSTPFLFLMWDAQTYLFTTLHLSGVRVACCATKKNIKKRRARVKYNAGSKKNYDSFIL